MFLPLCLKHQPFFFLFILFWFVLYHLCFLNLLCSAKLFQSKLQTENRIECNLAKFENEVKLNSCSKSRKRETNCFWSLTSESPFQAKLNSCSNQPNRKNSIGKLFHKIALLCCFLIYSFYFFKVLFYWLFHYIPAYIFVSNIF